MWVQEPVLQQKTSLLVEGLRDAGNQGEIPLNMQDWAQYVVTDIIGVLAMGVEFECLEKRRHHKWPSLLNSSLKTMMWVNVLLRFGMGKVVSSVMASKKAKQVAVDLLGQSQKYVQERLEREKTEQGRKERDIIGLILRDDQHEKDPLAEEEIYTMSVTLVGAGSETTSAALTGLMYYLVQDQGTLRKLTAEVREAFKNSEDVTVKGVAKLPYLNGAVEEGLRLFIPAPSLPPRVSPPGGHTGEFSQSCSIASIAVGGTRAARINSSALWQQSITY
jgi:cytochrome P450